MGKWNQAYNCNSCHHTQDFSNHGICEACGFESLSRGKAKFRENEWGERIIIEGSWKPRSEHVEGKK
jgi:ribosomal protein L37E